MVAKKSNWGPRSRLRIETKARRMVFLSEIFPSVGKFWFVISVQDLGIKKKKEALLIPSICGSQRV